MSIIPFVALSTSKPVKGSYAKQAYGHALHRGRESIHGGKRFSMSTPCQRRQEEILLEVVVFFLNENEINEELKIDD